MNPQGSPRANALGLLTIVVFAGLAVGSSKPKGDAGKSDASAASTATAAASGDPSKTAKLLGSCDRSETSYKSCSESYAPLPGRKTLADEKKSCESMGGKFQLGACPRINALTQCFQGNPGYLFGSYTYEGSKTKTDPESCVQGFRDYAKNPELKPSASPASCNAVETAGECSQHSAVTAEAERECLRQGAQLKQPPEPCPTANGLVAYKLQLKDGSTETEYIYSTPYTGLDGTHTWTNEDALLICALAGSACTKVPFTTAATSTTAAPAATSKVATKAKAKK